MWLWALSSSPQPGCAILPPPAVSGPCSQAVSASQAWCQLSAQPGATGKSPAAQVGELHGECPCTRSSVPTHLSFLFLQCHRIWPPQPPSQGPSRRGILFGVLKASAGPSQKSASSQNCLTKGPALGTSPNPPGPPAGWLPGVQVFRVGEWGLMFAAGSSRLRTGPWGSTEGILLHE